MIYKSIKIGLKLSNWSSVGVLLASSNSMFHQEIHWNVLNNDRFDQVTMGKEYEELTQVPCLETGNINHLFALMLGPYLQLHLEVSNHQPDETPSCLLQFHIQLGPEQMWHGAVSNAHVWCRQLDFNVNFHQISEAFATNTLYQDI